MELKAVVDYKGTLAHYQLSPDNYGIYQARLIKSEGDQHSPFPQHILLVKSVRRWVGSTEYQEVVNQLGDAIDAQHRNRDGSSPENVR